MQKRIKNENQETKVENLLSATMTKLKSMIDTDVVVGEKVHADGATIIPLTKLTVGFVAGGGEYGSEIGERLEDFPFAGGTGAGYTASPVGLVVITNGGKSIEFVSVNKNDPISKLIESLPAVVEKINEKLEKQKS